MLPLFQLARYPAKDGEEKLITTMEKGREYREESLVIEGQGLQA